MLRTLPQIPKKGFTRLLLKWNGEINTREMPWKGERDPYRVWLSEIILQQTRVEQGLNYYKRFIETFPDINSLARAPEAKVFKLWEGLGYYSRCRNLLATARYISEELGGKFPHDYESIRQLKGVGPYTAAAISSFAFDLPHAVVDGNVYRVLARVFGISVPTDTTAGKNQFNVLANELLYKENPGLYNQAIMDFGARVCKPAAPYCGTCIFSKKCVAFLNNNATAYPVKEKKLQIRQRWFYYFIVEHQNKIAIRQRTSREIWQGLYEFFLIETQGEKEDKNVIERARKEGWFQKKDSILAVSPVFKQQLSHQLIKGRFFTIKVNEPLPALKEAVWVTKKGVVSYAFPQFINQYLRQPTG